MSVFRRYTDSMRNIAENEWKRYVERLRKIDQAAADRMQKWIDAHGTEDTDGLIDYAFGTATKYGEASAALACEMYDAVAEAQGARVPPAEPAETATYDETAKAVRGTLKNPPSTVPATVGRLVKQAGADTTLKNARRDGAEFAWVPSGDSCAFCITLASRGWQKQSKKSAKSHAEHIHANCDCEYAVRFDGESTIAGYDPDRYLDMYYAAGGSDSDERIRNLRRELEAPRREEINAQKRAAYARRKEALTGAGSSGMITAGGISGALDPGSKRATEHAKRYYESVRHMTTDAQQIAENTGFSEADVQAVKDFIFNEKHNLGGSSPERFEPSYQMAESWQRLIDGKNIQPHDLTLLRHEAMERELMSAGMSQREAHTITSKKYDYRREADAFYDRIKANKEK